MAITQGIPAGWSPAVLGLLFFVLNFLWNLPDGWWWISLAVFVPVIPVQRTAQRVNAIYADSVEEPGNDTYNFGNVALIIIGSLVLALAIIGSFMLDSSRLPVLNTVMR